MKSLPLLWALILGVIGVAFGFFGPIAFSPDANQGPMLGIFVTGPAGLIVGFVLGMAVSFLPINRYLRYAILGIVCIGLAGVTLYLSMPAPAYQGHIIDAEVHGCAAPTSALGSAIEHWETEIAQAATPPRAGWKEAAQLSAQSDSGVVLEMHILRERPIYENQKPWNKGTLEASLWLTENEMRNYYARDTGVACSDYLKSGRKLYFPVSAQEAPNTWPPVALPNLLGMQVLEPVPGRYQSMTTD